MNNIVFFPENTIKKQESCTIVQEKCDIREKQNINEEKTDIIEEDQHCNSIIEETYHIIEEKQQQCTIIYNKESQENEQYEEDWDIIDSRIIGIINSLKIYCINLPASTLRKKNFLDSFNLLKDNDTLSLSFVTAFSPKDSLFKKIKNNPKKVINNKILPRCYCIADVCNNHYSRLLREVEIAISMSHLRSYKRLLKHNDKIAFICEDDIIFIPNMLDILKKVLHSIYDLLMSETPIIIFCGDNSNNNNQNLAIRDPSKFSLVLSETGVYSNYAYIINKAAAYTLKHNVYPISRPDDSYKRYLICKGIIKAYQIVPSIIAELSSGVNSPAIYNRLSKEATLEGLKQHW